MNPTALATLPTTTEPGPAPKLSTSRRRAPRAAPAPLRWTDGHVLYPDVYSSPSRNECLDRSGAYFAKAHGRAWMLQWREASGVWFLMSRPLKAALGESEWSGGYIGAQHLEWAQQYFERARAMGGSIDKALQRVRNEISRSDVLGDLATAFAPEADVICPQGQIHEAFARCLGNFAKHLLAMGWALTPTGEVLQPWRDRCRGRWVAAHTVFAHVERREPHWVRIEGERLLEVFEGCDGWMVAVDGKHLGETMDLDLAKSIALRGSRATATATTARPRGTGAAQL